jgi:acyl carrier protein
MMSQDLFEGVQIVFQTVFSDPALRITRAMTAEDVEGWDSFEHINLIMALEARFGVKFRLAELQELNCVGDMIDAISAKVGAS